jgi:hypothetical protein
VWAESITRAAALWESSAGLQHKMFLMSELLLEDSWLDNSTLFADASSFSFSAKLQAT